MGVKHICVIVACNMKPSDILMFWSNPPHRSYELFYTFNGLLHNSVFKVQGLFIVIQNMLTNEKNKICTQVPKCNKVSSEVRTK